MSTLRVDNIENSSGSSSPITIPGTAKAWANFDGTGTVAIRASYNVSSITDNGTGDYTVNFTTALTDSNYIFSYCGTRSNGTQFPRMATRLATDSKTSSEIRISILATGSTTKVDEEEVTFSFFR